MNLSKILSLLFSISYLSAAYFSSGAENAFRMFGYLTLPMACIWFGDEMGSVTGGRFGGFDGPVVTKTSPGCLVRFMGWVLLLLPVLLYLIIPLL